METLADLSARVREQSANRQRTVVVRPFIFLGVWTDGRHVSKMRIAFPASQDRARIIFDCRTVNDPASMSSTITVKTMTAGQRDKKMDQIATRAATEFCLKHENATDEQIKSSPETYLQYSIPYLTVRTLHRLEADSGWIKVFAIITGVLTAVLVALTIVLTIYALRLDRVIHSLSQ